MLRLAQSLQALSVWTVRTETEAPDFPKRPWLLKYAVQGTALAKTRQGTALVSDEASGIVEASYMLNERGFMSLLSGMFYIKGHLNGLVAFI